jgi:hypothetical protein
MRKVFQFPVLWEGWEIDSKGWVAEREDGTRALILTNHGSEYEADPEILEDRIAEYQRVIVETQKALSMLNT